MDLLHQSVQERSAPTATGTRSKALADLAGARNFFHADVVDHFTPRDVEAEAKFIIGLHGGLLTRCRHGGSAKLRCGKH